MMKDKEVLDTYRLHCMSETSPMAAAYACSCLCMHLKSRLKEQMVSCAYVSRLLCSRLTKSLFCFHLISVKYISEFWRDHHEGLVLPILQVSLQKEDTCCTKNACAHQFHNRTAQSKPPASTTICQDAHSQVSFNLPVCSPSDSFVCLARSVSSAACPRASDSLEALIERGESTRCSSTSLLLRGNGKAASCFPKLAIFINGAAWPAHTVQIVSLL